MKRRIIAFAVLFLFSAGIYFLLYHKDKNLNFIPENADAMILIDKKKLTRQYLSAFIAHPSQWFIESSESEKKRSVFKAGLKIPDFLQIFHLKNSKLTEWYAVFDIENPQKLLVFLKEHKFKNLGQNLYIKDMLYIKIADQKCYAGISGHDFEKIGRPLNGIFGDKKLNADHFMEEGTGSLSFISGTRTRNFSIELKDREIEIKNASNIENYASFISQLSKEDLFINAELNKENIKVFNKVLPDFFKDLSEVNHLKMNAKLKQVKDTIISYGYDDDFNEIEEISYQEIVQPDYMIQLETQDPAKIWKHFRSENLINDKNEFTGIPFQPNRVYQSDNGIVIKSVTEQSLHSQKKGKNFILIKNDPLLFSFSKGLNDFKYLKDIEYFFYGNKGQDFFLTLKLKDQKLPLILQ
ncbi:MULTISPECIES: hypothetical protein [Chryseobacterium]|uniref:Uncharacterized protein n=1 Tax=Chryseobacterium taihuense TaxID=1141221 RepID=A0A4V6IDT8_9FLAO|nr:MULTISPECIES: hypothetical protein [Chryseobacterium]QQV02366.1 hypothetical protein I6I61_15055 [Chryseobacterium sp. FDAARGOS 1104]VFB04384.1 Uncharacterised protein [Chryseobacterium taihuense]